MQSGQVASVFPNPVSPAPPKRAKKTKGAEIPAETPATITLHRGAAGITAPPGGPSAVLGLLTTAGTGQSPLGRTQHPPLLTAGTGARQLDLFLGTKAAAAQAGCSSKKKGEKKSNFTAENHARVST